MRTASDLTDCAVWRHVGPVRWLWLMVTIGTLCLACARDDDAEQLHQRIADGAGLAEAHEIGALLKLASEEVRAMPMNLDRRGIQGVLWQTFKRYGAFTILYPRPAIEMAAGGRHATTRFPFLIVKKEMNIPGLQDLREDPMAWLEAVDDHADLYRLRLQWIKKGGEWLVDQAFLDRFNGMGFE